MLSAAWPHRRSSWSPLEVRRWTAIIQQRIPCLTHRQSERSTHWSIWRWVSQQTRGGKGEEQRLGSQMQPGPHYGDSGAGEELLQWAHSAVQRSRGVESTFLPEWSAHTTAKPSNARDRTQVEQLWISSCHYQALNKATEPHCLASPSSCSCPRQKL